MADKGQRGTRWEIHPIRRLEAEKSHLRPTNELQGTGEIGSGVIWALGNQTVEPRRDRRGWPRKRLIERGFGLTRPRAAMGDTKLKVHIAKHEVIWR